MSDSNQSAPSGATPFGSQDVLRFSCGNCAKELSAPSSAAGVEGPCPVCGVLTTAPQVGTAGPPAIAPKPRLMPRRDNGHAGFPEQGTMPPPLTPPSAPGVVASSPAPSAAPAPAPSREQAPAFAHGAAETQGAPAAGPAPSRSPVPAERDGRRRVMRSIDPNTVLSADYEDRKDTKLNVRILLAILLTVAITFGVFYFMHLRFQEPPPEPEPEFFIRR